MQMKQRRPVVGRFPAGTANQRDADPDKRGGRCESIARVMLGVGLDGGASLVGANRRGATEKNELDHQDHDEDAERPRGRRMVRRSYFANRLERDADSSSDEHDRHDCGGEGFSLSIAKRIILVGIPACDAQTAPHDERRENVGGRFHRVGNKSVSVSPAGRR